MNAFDRLPKEKQLQILDAATACFAEKGYYGASIKDICLQANISNGALYKYFQNKEEVFLAVLNQCQNILTEHLYTKYTHIHHSLFTAVRNYLKGIENIHSIFPNYIKVYANLGSNNMEQFSQKLTQRFMESGTYIHNLVQEAIDRKEVPASMDKSALAFMLDNYFILFLCSLVSDYHEKRFRSFLRLETNEILTNESKIDFILESLQIFLNYKK